VKAQPLLSRCERTESRQRPSLDQKHILVIDDDESVLGTIARILELEDYIVETARTGKEAIEKSRLDSYNLAIIDLRLPDMDGANLLTAMQDTTPKMIKIMLTGYPSAEGRTEAIRRNADDYLVKPIGMDELLRIIRNHLKKQ
jgi:two-component system nitrogen regulation response regulator GlnG